MTRSVSFNAKTIGRTLRRPLVALTAAFVISRAVFYWVGVRFDPSEIQGGPDSDPWQLLDRHLLRTQLLSSIWHLQSQPPLFNLFCGFLLKLPAPWEQPVAKFVFLGLGLVIVLSTYQALVDLRVPRWLSSTVAILVILDPSNILYENWLSYAYPTAAALSFSVLCCVRYLRTTKLAWGTGFLLSLAAAILLNSSYQWLWLLVIVVLLLVAFRGRWRRTLAVAVLPVVLVGTWYVKDYVQFGTFTTSSWLGMNLADIALLDAPHGVVDRLVKQGTLTPLAQLFPFAPLPDYIPKWAKLPHTGVPALDEVTKRDGQPNYNNLAFVKISQEYLHDDLVFIRTEPGDYLAMVSRSATLFLVPGDEYPFVSRTETKISHWTRLYDGVVLWQLSNNEDAGIRAIFYDQPPEPSQVPYAVVLEWLLALLGAPIVAVLLWKSDRPTATTLLFLWITVGYAYVTTSFLEFGDNERFRFEVGTPPTIAAVAASVALTRYFRSRRERETVSDSSSGTPGMTDLSDADVNAS